MEQEEIVPESGVNANSNDLKSNKKHESSAKHELSTDKNQESEGNPLSTYLFNTIKDGFLYKPNCKFCSSIYKDDAEEVYDKHNSYKEVFEFFKSKNEPGITLFMIQNHVRRHANVKREVAILIEYAEDIENLRKSRRNKLSQLQYILDTCDLEQIKIIGKEDKMQPKERIDMMKKLFDAKFGALKLMNDMDNTEQQVRAEKDRILSLMKQEFENAKTDAEKEMIKRLAIELKELERKDQ